MTKKKQKKCEKTLSGRKTRSQTKKEGENSINTNKSLNAYELKSCKVILDKIDVSRYRQNANPSKVSKYVRNDNQASGCSKSNDEKNNAKLPIVQNKRKSRKIESQLICLQPALLKYELIWAHVRGYSIWPGIIEDILPNGK